MTHFSQQPCKNEGEWDLHLAIKICEIQTCMRGKEYKYKEHAESSETLAVHSSCPQSELKVSFLI